MNKTASTFNPFRELVFEDNICFLTGEEIYGTDGYIKVFPDWLVDKYGYRGQKFKMMDKSVTMLYENMVLPASESVKKVYEDLDQEIKEAFEQGYSKMRTVDDHKLYLWMGRIIYGILYNELLHERTLTQRQGQKFVVSPFLKRRLGVFHNVLKSAIFETEFVGHKPWSIYVVGLKYSKDIFNYHDDAINLLFSVGINGFGIMACLQDNGIVANEHIEILNEITDSVVLHPIQFEELWGRFLYSNYLLKYQPEFKFILDGNKFIIESLPVKDGAELFGEWEDKTYTQVLTEYWKPWGIPERDIYKFPNAPLSFLINERTRSLIEPESIELPF